jgi:hypothetical protein
MTAVEFVTVIMMTAYLNRGTVVWFVVRTYGLVLRDVELVNRAQGIALSKRLISLL